MEQLTPAQLEAIKRDKINRFKKMGLPATAGQLVNIPIEHMPGQPSYIQESEYGQEAPMIEEEFQYSYREPAVDTSNNINLANELAQQLAEERNVRQMTMATAPKNKKDLLNQIKRGAKKQEFGACIKAGGGVQGFQIPEPKVGKPKSRNPNDKPTIAVEVESFQPQSSSEANMLESMFTGGSSRPTSNISAPSTGNLISEDYSNYGASTDLVGQLRERLEKKVDMLTERAIPKNQTNLNANSGDISTIMEMIENISNKQPSNSTDMYVMKQMMEEIAKRVAEDTMKRVLKEYAENQKKKTVYEVVDSKQNVVKVGDKYFQLKPVTIKPKATVL